MTQGHIHLISASAGSGKTYKLVEELEAAITTPAAATRPEAVIATTFTVKAAAELRERVRSRLLERGRLDEAARLGAARIGTVNSVCSQLVSDFAFELGISPDVQVLDEPAAAKAFERALSSVVSILIEEDGRTVATASEEGRALIELKERWPGLDWLEDVRTIAQKARENGLGPADVRASAARSLAAFEAYFAPAVGDGPALERDLEEALATFVSGPCDGTKTTARVLDVCRQAHARLRAGRPLSWPDWAALTTRETAKGSRELYEPVRAAAGGHERHPGLRGEFRRCIAAVFEIAARALEAYECYKREWGLVDFVDQEVRALALLAMPGVQAVLRDHVDLVLVDEFQDTSPLQLDIFLALARIAPRSVWVGDQKQAIYGFRGTDPALMDTAVAAIAQRGGERPHESLGYSWRSRAELVRLTSAVFARAFAPHGIPADRVKLEPAAEIAERPDTLGPVVEGWTLTAKNVDDDALALAAAVRELLTDPDVRVRDVTTGDERHVEARDVAILCRSQENCRRVTRALEAGGTFAVRARAGLMATPEARLVLAALRLWVDSRQSLAAAEIGRLLVHPDDGDAWLRTVVESPGTAYTTRAEVERIVAARQRQPLAGPLAAFDEVIEAVGAREACLRWGQSAQRLANLDALRGFVHRYVTSCATEGEAATVAGLVAHLRALAPKGDDQATPSRENAVTVGTLHSAKGLEWPITVLHAIDSGHEPTAFGVHVVSDRELFDFDDPLGGRWIRYWPDPYRPAEGAWGNGRYTGKTELHGRVRQGREHLEAERREVREALRLLYVGWTRARDRIVLAGRPGKVVGDTLGLLKDADGRALVTEPADACTWAGRAVAMKVRVVGPGTAPRAAPEPGFGYDPAGPRDFPPARRDVSRLPGTGTLGTVEVIGPPVFVQQPVEPIALGNAIHAFFAADRPGLEPAERLSMARTLLEGWSVQGALRPEVLPAASDALRAWAGRRWPDMTWHREWPVRLRDAVGTELAGYADLLLMDRDRFVLVDHKCLGCGRDAAVQAALEYAGQLGAYADAVAKATGRQAAGCHVHLVTHGLIVEVH